MVSRRHAEETAKNNYCKRQRNEFPSLGRAKVGEQNVPKSKTSRGWPLLSDPRNHNHKSLAIANHNFEVASFSRRNRNEIAVSQVLSESQ